MDRAGDGIVLDGLRSWTLASLGYRDEVLGGTEAQVGTAGGDIFQSPAHGLIFDAPSGATQGPDLWWILHLHLHVDLPAAANQGDVQVSAATNGFTAAQIEFFLEPQGFTKVASSNLLSGYTEHQQHGRSIDIHYENYLQYRGITSGENLLAFKFLGFQGTVPQRVTLLNDSSLEHTSDSPYAIALHATTIKRRIFAGDRLNIAVQGTVDGRSGSHSGLRVSLAATPGLQGLTHSISVPGTLPIKLLHAGNFAVRLEASAPGHRPRIVSLGGLDVAEARHSSSLNRDYFWLAGGWFVIVAAGLLIWWRRATNGRSSQADMPVTRHEDRTETPV